MASPAALVRRAKGIRYLLFDVDGVLTDGTVTQAVDAKGRPAGETKSFFIRDGFGLKAARSLGFGVGLLSARASGVNVRRARELGLDDCLQVRGSKADAFAELCEKRKLPPAAFAFMGDDLVDLPVLAVCGLAAAPADAHPEVLAQAHWVSRHGGGRGAVREFTEMVFRWHGRYDPFVVRTAAGERLD